MEKPLRMVKPRLRERAETTYFYERGSGISLKMPGELVKSDQTFIVDVMNWRRKKERSGEEFHVPCEVRNADSGDKTVEGRYRQSVVTTGSDLATRIWKLRALICHVVCRVNVWSNCILYYLERGGSSNTLRWNEGLSIPVTPEHKYSVETPKGINVMQST